MNIKTGMQLFYITDIAGESCLMDRSESHHCIKVLRLKAGDTVHFVDGVGGFYQGVIEEDDPKACLVRIVKHTVDFGNREYGLHIAIAPTKNTERFEWFLEKVTEIGIDEITPLICGHSERRQVRADRLENILISAMKQSVKARKPILNEMVTFEAFLGKTFDGCNRYIAHCLENEKRDELLTTPNKGLQYLVLIGPEGDFTPEEVKQATDKGYKAVTLGSSRLRTETAGVVTAQIIIDKVKLKNYRQ